MEEEAYGDASDFEDSEAERREKAAKAKEQVPAFMTSHEGLDDEVERILGHRCVLVLHKGCIPTLSSMQLILTNACAALHLGWTFLKGTEAWRHALRLLQCCQNISSTKPKLDAVGCGLRRAVTLQEGAHADSLVLV